MFDYGRAVCVWDRRLIAVRRAGLTRDVVVFGGEWTSASQPVAT